MNKPAISRRRSARFDCNYFAWAETEGGAEDGRGVARAVDLSAHGVGLVSARQLPLGAKIVVELMLAGPLCIRGQGQIVHCQPLGRGQHRIGVFFEEPPKLVERNFTGEER